MVSKNLDLSTAMAADLQKKIEQVININQDKDHYYILVTLGMDEHALKTNIILLPPHKAQMLLATPLKATIMMEVNNQEGYVKGIWCLPKDMPGQGKYHGGNKFIHECSKYVPIRN